MSDDLANTIEVPGRQAALQEDDSLLLMDLLWATADAEMRDSFTRTHLLEVWDSFERVTARHD